MSIRSRRLICLLFILGLCAVGLAANAAGQPSFSFAQISDEHFPSKLSEETITDLAGLKDVRLKPYGVTAPAVSFVIETGDLTEFGDNHGAWAAHDRAFAQFTRPHYLALGNHDETWQALSPMLTRMYGAPYYSFNDHGCHFAILDSPGLQDPRPIIGPEQLEWLQHDLEEVGPDVPVFIALHHPLSTTEFSSVYETDRLVDLLRPYNVVALLVGHSHTINHTDFEGLDMIRGGSSQGPCPPGYMIYDISDGQLRVAYKRLGNPEATVGVMRKSILPPAKRYPAISLSTPVQSQDGLVVLSSRIGLPGSDVKTAYVLVDGDQKVEMKRASGGAYECSIATSKLIPGQHFARVFFEGKGGAVYRRPTEFEVRSTAVTAKWRADMGAASKSTPAVSGDRVFVGANDGYLRCYDRTTGGLVWRFRTGGAIAGGPVVIADRVYFGSADGRFYCISAAGDRVWDRDVKSPVFSPPVTDGKFVYFGCASGEFYSLNDATGEVAWVNTDAQYTIESRPFLSNGRVYYGSWDTYVYCLTTADGKLVWKCVGQGSAEKIAASYYAPADCGPVVCGGKVWIPDRKYRLSIIGVESGKIEKFLNGVSGLGLSEDSRSVYLRVLDGNLEKMDAGGNVLWKTKCQMDDVPTVPVESKGMVYVCSKRGLVSVLSAADGKIAWQYQVTPQSYVLSDVSTDGSGSAIVSGTDGSIQEVVHP